MNIFEIYLVVYTILAFSYLWYRYIFLLSNTEKDIGNYEGTVSIIIPFYDEDPDLLIKTVKSAYECYGDNEIIVIDDGSKNILAYNKMLELQKQIPFELIRYEENKGKRYAQCLGFEKAKGDIIMTLDSDTILDKNAIINLIKPFSDNKVGATTGNLDILNKKKNLLTKMISARYWNAFNFERKSQSKLGVVICCTGPISAYRSSIIKNFIPEYKNQTFMGKDCTFGDDRHLTTLTIKDGWDIKYVQDAKAYTLAQETWRKFTKQQIRWKKSWLRETFLVSRFMFKRGFSLSFEILITTFITFFSIFARIGLVIALLLNPLYILIAIPMIGLMATLHSLYLLFNKREYFVYSILYGFVHAFFIYWLVFIALFTFKDTKWGTR